jgi:RHS repeat-associated protein
MREASKTRLAGSARRWRVPAVVALLVVLAGVLPAQSGNRPAVQRPPARPLGTQSTPVVIFPLTQFHGPGGTVWALYTDTFSADSVHGWRYTVELTNHNGATGAAITVNYQQFVGTSDFGSGTSSLTRTIDVVPGENDLQVSVKGPTTAYVEVRILRSPEPAFVVFPRRDFVSNASVWTDTQTVTIPAAAGTPHTLWAHNGDSIGVDHRLTNATIGINGTKVLSGLDFGTGKAAASKQVSLRHDTTNTLTVYNTSGSGTRVALWLTSTGTLPPAFSLASPSAGVTLTTADTVVVQGEVADSLHGVLTLSLGSQSRQFETPGPFTETFQLPAEGRYDIHLAATNSGGFTTDSVCTVYRGQAPVLSVSQPADLVSNTSSSTATLAGTWAAFTNATVTVNGDTLSSGTPSGSFSHPVSLAFGANTFTIRVRDVSGNGPTVVRTLIYESAGAGSAEPTAPAIASTQLDDFRKNTSFLYASGGVQVGPNTSTFQVQRTAVVRGRVVQATESADTLGLAHVRVTVVGHDEYGYTDSRESGNFDLVVNGGGQLTLQFARAGFATARRTVNVPWRDYVRVEDVALKGFDPKQTEVSLASAAGVARGSRIVEGDSIRTPTMLFRAGTVATGIDALGNPVSLGSTFHVRATEFSVGPEGPRRMPAPLPSTSAYTHCVDLTVMEAESQGIRSVTFSTPVAYYIENFLGLPVGINIPVGSYGPDSGWKAEEDGRVIQVLSTTGGVATLDVTGDSLAATGAALDSLGIDSTELRQLAGLYRPGQTLWRSRVDHFSTWDWNFPFWFPIDAIAPNGGWPFWLKMLLGFCSECPGSTIEMENQTLREAIGVVGTPYALHYSSARVPGNRRPYQIRVPLWKVSLPSSVSSVVWSVDVAGRHYGATLPNVGDNPAPEYVDMEWDGRDVYGREVPGSVNAHIKVGYAYQNVYGIARTGGGRSWGNPPEGARLATSVRGNEGTIWTEFDLAIGTMRNDVAGLGGWSISPNHFYDMSGRGTLYRGDGTAEPGERTSPGGSILFGLDHWFVDLAYSPDGTLYYTCHKTAETSDLFRWTPGSAPTLLTATSSSADQTSEGVDVSTIGLPSEVTLALGSDGSIFLAEPGNHRVRRVDSTGVVRTIVGQKNSSGTSGDGGPALNARLKEPTAIAVGPDGTLYIMDQTAYTIRRVAPDGTIYRFAGNGRSSGRTDLDARADTSAINPDFGRVRVGPNGDVVFAEPGALRVRRITPDGIMHVIGKFVYPASPVDVQYSPDGVLHVLTGGREGQTAPITRVWRLAPGQPEVAIAGAASGGLLPILATPSYPALAMQMAGGTAMAFNPDGGLAVGAHRRSGSGTGLVSLLYAVKPVLPGFSVSDYLVVSRDASEQYVFDVTGRHLRTLDGLTRGTRAAFRYQGFGSGDNSKVLLHVIYDMNGDSTVIHRSSAGTPLDITAPDGQATTLELTDSYLSAITNPTGTQTTHLYPGFSSGLLDSLRDARGYSHQFEYETDGRLRLDRAADGFSTTMTAEVRNDSLPDRKIESTSALNRRSSYSVDFRDNRQTEIRTTTGSDNLEYVTTKGSDEAVTVSSPDGSSLASNPKPDPRFGMQAPYPGTLSATWPVTGTSTITTTQSYNPGTLAFSSTASVNGRSYAMGYSVSGSTRTVTLTPPVTTRAITGTVDTVGRPLTLTMPGVLADVTTHYDSRGRVDVLQVGARQWEYHYEDSRGRLTRIVDPLGDSTKFQYDEADRLQWQVLPGGTDTVYFEHDAGGNLTALKPPGRLFHRFAFTPGELTRQYDPPDVPGLSPNTTHYGFDADRQLTTVNRPDGQSVTLGYDATTGQLKTVAQPRGVDTLTYHPSGDGAGQIATLTSPDGVDLAFGYDGNLPTSESWDFRDGVAGSVSYLYNVNLWPTHQTVTPSNGSASQVTYGFDTDGLVTSAAMSGGATLTLAQNTVTSVLDGTSVLGLSTRHGHNPYAELTSSAAWYGTDSLLTARYDRDALGRITRIVETTAAGTTDRGYHYFHDRGQLEAVRDSLTHVDIARYRYDPNGNRLGLQTATDSVTAAYDEQDRLVDRGNAHYTYTANGERLTRTQAGATVSTTYDLLGNLVKVKLASGDSVEYVVDGRNRRVGRKLNGTLTARWVYGNDLNVVGELDAAGVLTKRFVYASSSHVPDLMVVRNPSGPDSTYRFVTDHLGSVRLVVNANTGIVAQRLAYDAWGVVTLDTQPGFTPFGYAGGLYDPATALVRFGARDYDPEAGVWTCKDPIGVEGGVNLYAYADAGPISAADPTGLDVMFGYYDGAGIPNTPVGAGHSGIGVNSSVTFGFYPANQNVANLGGLLPSPGKLAADRGRMRSLITIKTTAIQDEIVKAMLEERHRRPGTFGPGRMCHNFDMDVLSAIGIHLPRAASASPGALEAYLELYAAFRPDRISSGKSYRGTRWW